MEKELQFCVEAYNRMRELGYSHKASLLTVLELMITIVANDDASKDGNNNNKEIEKRDE